MLSDFAEKKEAFFTLKNRIFQSPNNAYVTLKREKKPTKNSIFQSLKDRIFSKGLTHAFGQKNAIFFFI